MKFIIKYLPFVGIIAVNSIAVAGRYRLEDLKPFILVISTVVLLNFVIAIIAKVKSYFVYGVSGIVIIGAISVFYFPSLGQIYLENAIAGLYLGLFWLRCFRLYSNWILSRMSFQKRIILKSSPKQINFER